MTDRERWPFVVAALPLLALFGCDRRPAAPQPESPPSAKSPAESPTATSTSSAAGAAPRVLRAGVPAVDETTELPLPPLPPPVASDGAPPRFRHCSADRYALDTAGRTWRLPDDEPLEARLAPFPPGVDTVVRTGPLERFIVPGKGAFVVGSPEPARGPARPTPIDGLGRAKALAGGALQYALDDDGRLYRWEEQERVVEPCAPPPGRDPAAWAAEGGAEDCERQWVSTERQLATALRFERRVPSSGGPCWQHAQEIHCETWPRRDLLPIPLPVPASELSALGRGDPALPGSIWWLTRDGRLFAETAARETVRVAGRWHKISSLGSTVGLDGSGAVWVLGPPFAREWKRLDALGALRDVCPGFPYVLIRRDGSLWAKHPRRESGALEAPPEPVHCVSPSAASAAGGEARPPTLPVGAPSP